jgi:hypothetical protein
MWGYVFPSDPSSKSRRSAAMKLVLLFGAATALWLSSAACQLGEGECLRMSECDTGYSCVEGTCRSNIAADAPNTAPDASTDARATSRADAAATDASRDGSTDGSASDSGTDGSMTDASGS